MKNRKVMLLIPALIGIIFVLPLISAFVRLSSPSIDGNYSTTMAVNCTNTEVTPSVNATAYYNSSGGDVNDSTGTLLITIANTSANQQHFYDSAVSISGLSDLRTYNFTCVMFNISGAGRTITNATAFRVTIDNTNPTNGISLDTESLSARDSILITWSYTDATSGLLSYSTTINPPPNSPECSIVTESGTSGTDALVDEETYCPGTYTVNATVTDYAGNTNNISKTFKVTTAGKTKIGSNLLGSEQKSTLWKDGELPLGEAGTNIAILIILGVAFYYLLKKK